MILKPVPVLMAGALSTALLGACSGTPDPAENTAGTGGLGTGGTESAGRANTGGQAALAGAGGSGMGGGRGGEVGSPGGSGGAGTGGTSSGGGAGKTNGSGGAGSGGTSSGGASATGGMGGGSAGASGGTTSGLPPLHVDGPAIKDPNGKTIVLRGVDVPDLGTLYANGGQNVSGVTGRIDKVLAAGMNAHVIRLAVYPRTCFNGSSPFYSPVPFPVGQMAPAGMHQDLSQDDYFSKILVPSVEYAQQKNMYAIIDYHQIDDATGQSGADAVTFWQAVAPKFASYDNVIFEPFNEPIDTATPWSTFKTTVQTLIDAIRAGAPNNLIVVPSMSWDQHPGDAASSAPSGSNLVYTAHVYPGNWNTNFKQQVTTAVALAPVFFTEWGYVQDGKDKNLGTSDANWGTDFQALLDMNGSSWSAWVADSSWTPNLFADMALSSLTPFGTLTATWLTAKAPNDWVF
ncbi:MAG TPA: cellulase family glycosylhydrolase [Polyangiaceae bacterium]|jgi:hypothetical protein|nr:cellulase family glycosylhydrolase [Polyangiaceae bacterium]